jgi:RimJ/RimL family protein N-acetyltransferase
MKREITETKRLILRPLKLSDYNTWFDAWTNRGPAKNRWDYGPMKAKDCGEKYFKWLLKRHRELAKKDDWYFFGIFEKKTGTLVGHVDLDIFVRGTHQFANFGYRLHNRYWGKGYGQEAARAGLHIGFKQLKLNRLEAAINLDNRKSIRLVKAIGMKREGIKRRYWFEDGKWVDHLIYVANPEDIGLKARKPF